LIPKALALELGQIRLLDAGASKTRALTRDRNWLSLKPAMRVGQNLLKYNETPQNIEVQASMSVYKQAKSRLRSPGNKFLSANLRLTWNLFRPLWPIENQLLLEFEHNAHHETKNDWPDAQEGRSSEYFLFRSR